MSGTTVPRNPSLAAVMSLVVPGVGQIYNGDFLRGIFWLIVTPGMWIGSAACSAGSATSSPPPPPTIART
jgi:TM2 domain-containing membrane protein YozV